MRLKHCTFINHEIQRVSPPTVLRPKAFALASSQKTSGSDFQSLPVFSNSQVALTEMGKE